MAIGENPTYQESLNKEGITGLTKKGLENLMKEIKIAQEKMDILIRNNDKIDGLSPSNKELIKNALENVKTEEVRYIADNPVLKNLSGDTLTQEISKLAKDPLSVGAMYRKKTSFEIGDTVNIPITATRTQNSEDDINTGNDNISDRSSGDMNYVGAGVSGFTDAEFRLTHKENGQDTMIKGEIPEVTRVNQGNNFGEFAEIDNSGDTPIINESPGDLASENGEEVTNYV